LDFRRAAPAVAALLAAGALAPAAAAQSDPPISEQRATEIARADENAREAAAEHPGLNPSADQADHDGDWEVTFYADDERVVQVIVDDQTGEIEESWTGHQVTWKMARGYEGAFGRTLNAPYVWLPLCAIFLLGLFDWRRPFRMAHLDLLVIVAGFGVSHFFFNRGEIGLSVPLAYPALLYLLARTLWLAFRRRAPGLRPAMPLAVLAVATLFLIGVRVGLNVADSNVIDVGYSGVVGADKITDYEGIYGDFPENNSHGDTYGPVAYYVYVPFEFVFPWSGDWDELPAAHAAAIFFDLLTIAGLFLLGRRLRPGAPGTYLGTVLAFAWTANPYTAFVLESNTNDALVSMFLVGVLLVLSSPPARGGMLALATATKFAPVFLFPLLATFDRDAALRRPSRRAVRVVTPYAAAFALVTLAVIAQTLFEPGLDVFWDRTVGNQAARSSPFSVWGQADLDWLNTVVKVAIAALAVAVAFLPRRRDIVTVAALGAAVMIATQLAVEHWFYLYIPWFLPLLLVALLARPEEAARTEPAPAAG
jgi:hypothetical protein